MQTQDTWLREVKLPKRVNFKTPLPLIADAYTVGSDFFASKRAKKWSLYYLTFRRELEKINPDLYAKGDNRIIFNGLSRILDYLFYTATTQEDVDLSVEFLSNGKVTAKGLKPFPFPKYLWDRVVKEFNGRPPIRIRAVREGSVVYPNEPILTVESMADGFGELAAWFESTILKIWASCEMPTQLMHWLLYCKSLVDIVWSDVKTEDEKWYIASCMLHNFGCRAGMVPQESEWLGSDSLLVFPSTDTFSGAFQAWMNSDKAAGIYVSIQALAHRNVQGYEVETDCFRAMKDSAEPGDFNSNVADAYDYWTANEGPVKGQRGKGSLLDLALESKENGDEIVTISRPDSGIPEEQVMWLIRLAHSWGLSVEEVIKGKVWRFGTNLKVLEGDGMKWAKMKQIFGIMMEQGFAPFGWGVPFGVGGGLRNAMARDNFSAKFALCAVGEDKEGVCKFSETLEKGTLPGPFKLLRSPEALAAKKTIAFDYEDGEDALVDYFNGADIWEPFKEGYGTPFPEIKKRMMEQMLSMPKTLTTVENHNYPVTDAVRAKRIELLKRYAPKKLAQNY